jgi:hypothetical protein
MLKTLFLLAAAAAASGGGDPWTKVRELPGGSEVRIYKTGVRRPVEAKFHVLGEDALIVVVKNAEIAVAKHQIERVDARAAGSGSRAAMETRRNVGTKEEAAVGRSKDPTLPPRSTSSGITIRSKPAYETVYQRPAASGK